MSSGADLIEGFHLLAMLEYLQNLVIWSEKPATVWNYALDHVRFISVIRLSD